MPAEFVICFCLLMLLVRASAGLQVVPTQLRLVRDMLETYDKQVKPTWDHSKPINVTFSIDLYQILELNEPQQYVLLNAWIIERWNDEFLYWNPSDYDNVTEIRLPHHAIWLPDTTLYNSLVMKDDDTRRLLNAKLTTNASRRAAFIELLYPTIYKFSCLLNLRFFPFDTQACTMTFSSWTYDQKGIDYFSYSDTVGTTNYIENEGWHILKTAIRRKEVRYKCCPNAYTLLFITIYLRRKPLFYLVNLIIPTSIITLIAIVGFFSTSSASGMREEKVSLGITTLLSMSILMLMVSDQMPTTSTFIPLIGWFILGMIIVISIGTLTSSVIIAIQKRGRLGERLSANTVPVVKLFSCLTFLEVPAHLRKGTKEASELPEASEVYRRSVRISNKLSRAGLHKKSWFTFTKSFASSSDPPLHGVSIISDKSTDLLMPPPFGMDASRQHRALDASPTLQSLPSLSEGTLGLTSTTAPLASMPRMSDDERGSVVESDNETVRSPPPISGNPSDAPPNNKHTTMIKHLDIFAGNLKQSRKLALEEYEWLATVIERCCFLFFVVGFLFLSIGINALGYYHWYKAADDVANLD